MEVEASLHQRIERLEQALLEREAQGQVKRALLGRQLLEVLQFGWGEDLLGQAFGAFSRQQGFGIQAQPAPGVVVADQGGGPAVAVGDAAGDAGWPAGRVVLASGREAGGAAELAQGAGGAQAPGEEFALPLAGGRGDAGGRRQPAAGEVVGSELRRVEAAAVQDQAGQRLRQRPVGLEGAAAGGQGGVGRGHAGSMAQRDVDQ
ncbi:hypothetical protein D3C78_1157410 [compost metagenome]